MPKRNIKWTQDLRKILYARLVMEFGPHIEWGVKNYPKGKRERYFEVLEELASYFHRVTGDKFEATALDQQVAWAVTRQANVTSAGFAYQFVMNKAAALDAGFLISAELPDYMVTESAD